MSLHNKGTFTATFTVKQEGVKCQRPGLRAADMRDEIEKTLCSEWQNIFAITIDSATFTPDPAPRYVVKPFGSLFRVYEARYCLVMTHGMTREQAEAVAKTLNELEEAR